MKRTQGISRTSKALMILAIVVACFVGFGMHQYLSQQRTMVYLFKDNYTQGTKITKEMFSGFQIDTDLYNAQSGTGNKYVSADDIIQYIESGDTLSVNVAKFTTVTANQFVSSGGTGIESRLAPNMGSVELLAEKVSGLSADVRIGSRLNLINGYAIDAMKQSTLSFQDLLVVDVVRNSDGNLHSVYVEVDPSETIELVHFLTFEYVTASIIKPGSYIPVNENETTFIKNYSSEMTGLTSEQPQIGANADLERQQVQQQ